MTVIIEERLVAERIAEALHRKGLRPEDVASLLGVTERAVYHWLSGARRPRAQLLIALSEVVQRSPSWLMGRPQ